MNSEGKLFIRPGDMLPVKPAVNHYIGVVVVVCDGRDNSKKLQDLFLKVKSKGQVMEEKLQDRGATSQKKTADVKNFKGDLNSKTLNYTIRDPKCDMTGMSFECEILAEGDSGPFKKTANLTLELTDGEVVISPRSDTTVQRTVNTKFLITCSAILAKNPTAKDVEWEWTKKDDGESDFSALEEDVVSKIVTKEPTPGAPCGGSNSTSVLNLVLENKDHRRMYRCAFKNKKTQGSDAGFNYTLAKSYSFGAVQALDPGEKEETKVVYSTSSLVGMIMGIFSFITVCFLGLFYIYRKNRGGKKYDIVTALLNQEEEELTRIEQRLGGGLGGASGVEESSVAPDETSGVESTSAAPESSVGPSSSAVESTSAAPESSVMESEA